MGKLAETPIPNAEDAKAEIEQHLETWRCRLVAFDRGASNLTMTRDEIVGHLDVWLDRYLELRGN